MYSIVRFAMFCVEKREIQQVLQDYGICSVLKEFTELQSCYNEQNDLNCQEVRLIIRADLEDASSLVVRFKNEKGVTQELLESQCCFAEALYNEGIVTPTQYKSNGKFANRYEFGGYDVLVTVEEFVEQELQMVDEWVAGKTGALLAKIHTISESNDLHVQNQVLFDPFTRNELFAYDVFLSLKNSLENQEKVLFEKIVEKYFGYMDVLAPLKNRPQYAVQGDISDCNLYQTQTGEIGVFDYNRSGDNNLFCDAVMQAVFEARLMDYPERIASNPEPIILKAFLDGYQSVRRFTEEEKRWFPYLYAIINAFWSADICWNDDCLLNVYKVGDRQKVRQWLTIIEKRLNDLSVSL